MKKSHELVERLLRALINLTVIAVILAVWPTVMDPAGDTKRMLVHWSALFIGYGYLVYQWRMGVKLKFPRMFGSVFAGFLAIYFVATFASSHFDLSFLEASHFLLLFMLYMVAAQVFHTPRQAQGFFFSVCAGTGIAACYGFLQKLGWDPFPWGDQTSDVYQGLPSTYGNPNFAAHVLVLALVFGIYLMLAQWAERKDTSKGKNANSGALWILGLLLALALLHLIFTGQRAGFLALAGAAVLLLFAHLVGRRFANPARGAAVTLGLLGGAALAGAGAVAFIAKSMTGIPLPLDTSILIRYQSYVSAARMLFDNPLLGHGPAVYRLDYPLYWRPIEQQWFAEQRMLNAHVHNDLMELGIDAGLLAAGAYLLLLVLGMGYGLSLAFREASRGQRLLGYTMAAFFCVFFIDGLFGFNLRTPASATIFFLACGVFEGLRLPAFVPEVPDNRRFMSRPWRVAAVFLLPVILILQTRDFRSSRDQHLGLEALAQRNLKEALARFRAAEMRTPWNGEYSRRQGLIALGQGFPQEGAIHLANALEKHPNDVLTMLGLAQAKMLHAQKLSEEGQAPPEEVNRLFNEAEGFAEQALKISPFDPTGHDLLGRIASLKALQLTKSPATSDPAELAALWQRAEDHLLAATSYNASNKAELYLMLAEVRSAQEDLPGAEEALTRAVEAEPAQPALWERFQQFAAATQRYGRLRSTINAQLRRLNREATPDPAAIATSYVGLGEVLAEGYGDWEQADAAFIEAVTQAPGRSDLWARFGNYALKHNRLHPLRQALDSYAATEQQRLTDEALKHVLLAQRASQGEQSLNALSSELMALFKMTEPVRAAQHYGWVVRTLARQLQEAQGAPATLCEAHVNLGILLNQIRQNEEAARLLAAAQSCATPEQRPMVAVHLGDALIQLGRAAEAVEVLRQASQAFPQNIDVRWAFARGLGRLGMTEDAKAAYRALIEEPWLDVRGKSVLQKELDAL